MNSEEFILALQESYPNDFVDKSASDIKKLIDKKKLSEAEIERFYKDFIENYQNNYREFPEYSVVKKMLATRMDKYKQPEVHYDTFNLQDFEKCDVHSIIKILKEIHSKKKITNKEMDFYCFFDVLWSEYCYIFEYISEDYLTEKEKIERKNSGNNIRESLKKKNWTEESGWKRLNNVLNYIYEGKKFKSIYDIDKFDGRDNKKKTNCLISKYLKNSQDIEVAISNPDYFHD